MLFGIAAVILFVSIFIIEYLLYRKKFNVNKKLNYFRLVWLVVFVYLSL